MGRLYVPGVSDRLHTDTVDMRGFDFTWGTCAALFYRTTDTGGFETLLSTNAGSASAIGYNIDTSDRHSLYSTFGDNHLTTVISTGKYYLMGHTKATGNVAPRGHVLDTTTGTWTHTAAGSSGVDYDAAVSFTFGGYQDSGGSDPLSGEMQQFGIWHRFAMSDQEFERLGRNFDWMRLGADFVLEETQGREASTLGFRTLQGRMMPKCSTANSGTPRGVQRHARGSRPSAQRRRR